MDEVSVVGAGGIGCAVAHALLGAGENPTIVESDPAKVAAGRRDHLRVRGHPPRPARFVDFRDWHPRAGSTILLCTKCYDNAEVLARLPKHAVLIPIQNGFDPTLAGLGHGFEGIASFVSECEPGRPSVRITRRGDLHIGRRCVDGPLSPRPAILDLLKRSTLFRSIEVDEIEPFKYAKLMYNAAIAPVAAAAGVDNGQILSNPAARRPFFNLLDENWRILTAARIRLGRVGPLEPATVARILRHRWLATALAPFFERSLRGTYCSMAGDIGRGPTEIDNYNGHLVRLARRAGMPCPLNEAAIRLVEAVSARRWERSTEVWRLLTAA
ncbi:ketopantoate reductase family protein [Aquisphaera insulae]|uniref:ketopantoate reductase family protein n=1 Tax=Aquisphaera insulae TaxID=2712864 RepID=UPI0013E99EFC|nr:ketopantoate reductase family protein [Aquisphaera insulae]